MKRLNCVFRDFSHTKVDKLMICWYSCSVLLSNIVQRNTIKSVVTLYCSFVFIFADKAFCLSHRHLARMCVWSLRLILIHLLLIVCCCTHKNPQVLVDTHLSMNHDYATPENTWMMSEANRETENDERVFL